MRKTIVVLLLFMLIGSTVSFYTPKVKAFSNPYIIDVGISYEEYSVPITPPITQTPGGHMRLWYHLYNPNPTSINVILGASIQIGGSIYSDPSNDRTVSISPGDSWANRYFYVPTGVPTGSYNVIFAIWDTDWNPQYDSETRIGWVNMVSSVFVQLSSYVLNTGASNVGTIVWSGITYSLPATISTTTRIHTISANPPSGYSFHHWESTGAVNPWYEDIQSTVASVDGSGTLKAVFTVNSTPPSLTLYDPSISDRTVTFNGVVTPGTPGTTITRINWNWGDGSSGDSWFPASHTYSNYGGYTVTATAYQSDGLTTTQTKYVSLTAPQYTVTVNPNGGRVYVDGSPITSPTSYTWSKDSVHILDPDSGYQPSAGTRLIFNKWSDGSTADPRSITVTGSATYTVEWTTQYQLTIGVSPSGAGTTNPAPGAYWYNKGTSVTVTETPNTGYNFDHWELDGNNVGAQISYSVIMNNMHTLTAIFGGIPTLTTNAIILKNPVLGETVSLKITLKNTGTKSLSGGTYLFTITFWDYYKEGGLDSFGLWWNGLKNGIASPIQLGPPQTKSVSVPALKIGEEYVVESIDFPVLDMQTPTLLLTDTILVEVYGPEASSTTAIKDVNVMLGMQTYWNTLETVTISVLTEHMEPALKFAIEFGKPVYEAEIQHAVEDLSYAAACFNRGDLEGAASYAAQAYLHMTGWTGLSFDEQLDILKDALINYIKGPFSISSMIIWWVNFKHETYLRGFDLLSLSFLRAIGANLGLIFVTDPVNLLIVDPSGCRVGVDPVSGAVVNEILDAYMYGINGTIEAIFIPSLLEGNYFVYCIGSTSGSYGLHLEAANGTAVVCDTLYSGTIEEGQILSSMVVIKQIGTSLEIITTEPLSINIYVFEVICNCNVFNIVVKSNSTVSDFNFVQQDKEVKFNVTGLSGTFGFCNVTIHKELLYSNPADWIVLMDGEPILPIISENETHTMLYFKYLHSTHTIQIIGTYVYGQPQDFTLSPVSTSLTIPQGGSKSLIITITSINGFSQPVQLSLSHYIIGGSEGIWGILNPEQVTPPPDGSVSSILTFYVSPNMTPGTYEFYVEGKSGSLTHVIYISLEVILAPSQLLVSINPLSALILVDQSVTFTSTVSGGITPYNYQWYLNGSAVSGATSNAWTFAPSTIGTYVVYLRVTDNAGNVATSETATIVVAPKLTASISPKSTSIIVGQSVTFTSTVLGGYPPYSYQWFLNGAPVSGATSASWAFTPTTAGIYYVQLKVTDDKGNTAQSEAARITVATVPVGGYSIPIQLPTEAKPVAPYIALLAILTTSFITIKRKTKRKH